MPDYRVMVTLSAAGLVLMGLGWLIKGEFMLKRWRLVPNDVALLVGRRIGTVYLGTASLLMALRSVDSPEAQRAVCVGSATFALLVALVGIYEFVRQRVGPAMLISVMIEVALAMGFVALVLH